MQEVCSFKLTSGEEIIAKVVSKPLDTDIVKDWVIEMPYVIMLMELEVAPGQMQVMPMPAAPWILLAQKATQLTLGAHLIMHVNDVVPQPIEQAYLQQTTPIQLAP